MNPKSKRNPALDLIRCLALFCVAGVHFFLYNGFYEEAVSGIAMYLLTILRMAMMICVPLFLLLSGWLCRTRELKKGYFGKIRQILVIYILASLCCGAFNALLMAVFQHELLSPREILCGILSYDTAPYGWYVEMYIGLYCLIPFLNVLYNNLKSRQEKLTLIAVFLFLTALPDVCNIHQFSGLGWWLQPSSSEEYTQLLPSYWTLTYPLTYYFIGCYLSEYPITIKRSRHLALTLLSLVLSGSFAFYRSRGSGFLWGRWQEYSSLLVLIPSVLVFSWLAGLDLSGLGSKIRRILARCSDLTFGAYLVSWIFDKFFYLLLDNIQPTPLFRFLWFPVVVPLICLCSLCLSGILQWIYSGLSRHSKPKVSPQPQ